MYPPPTPFAMLNGESIAIYITHRLANQMILLYTNVEKGGGGVRIIFAWFYREYMIIWCVRRGFVTDCSYACVSTCLSRSNSVWRLHAAIDYIQRTDVVQLAKIGDYTRELLSMMFAYNYMFPSNIVPHFKYSALAYSYMRVWPAFWKTFLLLRIF